MITRDELKLFTKVEDGMPCEDVLCVIYTPCYIPRGVEYPDGTAGYIVLGYYRKPAKRWVYSGNGGALNFAPTHWKPYSEVSMATSVLWARIARRDKIIQELREKCQKIEKEKEGQRTMPYGYAAGSKPASAPWILPYGFYTNPDVLQRQADANRATADKALRQSNEIINHKDRIANQLNLIEQLREEITKRDETINGQIKQISSMGDTILRLRAGLKDGYEVTGLKPLFIFSEDLWPDKESIPEKPKDRICTECAHCFANTKSHANPCGRNECGRHKNLITGEFIPCKKARVGGQGFESYPPDYHDCGPEGKFWTPKEDRRKGERRRRLTFGKYRAMAEKHGRRSIKDRRKPKEQTRTTTASVGAGGGGSGGNVRATGGNGGAE